MVPRLPLLKYSSVRTMDEESARVADLYHVIGYEADDAYIAELKKQSVHPEVIRQMADDFTIVYTPLHGTGNVFVRRVLKELGFNKVYTVPEQEKPDGNFPTVSYPNPESPKAFELALELAEEKDADLVLATDPDADRLGVYCKDAEHGRYISFTGNMSGVIIGEYLLREKKATGTLPANAAVVETIVTTDMLKPVAADYGVDLIEVLTGFKYIGEQIKLFKESRSHEFVFGMEESYGCLAGTYARDKDAPVAVMLLCEAACWYKSHGKTLWDAMEDIYKKYGYYRETLSTITKTGEDGARAISAMMDKMRTEQVSELGGHRVLALRDYKTGIRRDFLSEKETKLTLPESNVLYYELSDNAWCCVRPSGTEPKIKFYMGVKGSSIEDADQELEVLKKAMTNFAEG